MQIHKEKFGMTPLLWRYDAWMDGWMDGSQPMDGWAIFLKQFELIPLSPLNPLQLKNKGLWSHIRKWPYNTFWLTKMAPKPDINP